MYVLIEILENENRIKAKYGLNGNILYLLSLKFCILYDMATFKTEKI